MAAVLHVLPVPHVPDVPPVLPVQAVLPGLQSCHVCLHAFFSAHMHAWVIACTS